MITDSQNKQFDLLCFGEPLYEFNQRDDGSYIPGYGGDVSNCAIAAARCGARVAMLAHIGQDRFGDNFMQLWRQEGVDTAAVVLRESFDTGVYFVSHDGDGHHFSYIRRHSAAANISVDDIERDIARKQIERSAILHVSAISQAISDSAAEAVVRAIDIAKEAGTCVSYDTNLRLKLWSLGKAQSVIHQVIGRCDLVLPGHEDAMQLTGKKSPDAIVDFYLNQGSSVVALTLGQQGVLVATPERRERLDAHPVEAIDCTGAGDTFDGAFLSAFASSQDPFAAARFANAAAALSTTGAGAVGSLPARGDIDAFLSSSS